MIIYRTTNLINGKSYIGKDTKNNKNYLGSGLLLKSAIEKYSRENFIKEILEVCTNHDELKEREKFWINYYDAVADPMYYNIREGGDGGDTFTNNPNKELVRQKLSGENSGSFKHLKGKTYEEIYGDEIAKLKKEKMQIISSGKTQSYETINKRIQHYKGVPRPDDVKKKISKSHIGLKHTEETKKKISKAGIGRIVSLETRNKHSLSSKGTNNPNSALLAEQVNEIRSFYEEHRIKMKVSKIIKMFSEKFLVSTNTIRSIIQNKTYKI
jgi:hypothetical protein